MIETSKNIYDIIENAKKTKTPVDIEIHRVLDTKIHLKVDFFDYNYELYISLFASIENAKGNRVECSIEQFKFDCDYTELNLKNKLNQSLDYLNRELEEFES